MAITAKLYGKTLLALADARIDWTTDTFKLMLAKPTYVPNQDTDDFRNDVTAGEFAVAGDYVAGGAAMTGLGTAYDAAANLLALLATGTVAWTNLTGTARYAVVYKSRGGVDTADELVGYVDFGADQVLAGVGLQVAWPGGTVYTGTVA